MSMMEIEFAGWLKNTKNFATSTIEIYLRALKLLDNYMRELTFGERGVEYPYTIQLEDIEQFAENQRIQ